MNSNETTPKAPILIIDDNDREAENAKEFFEIGSQGSPLEFQISFPNNVGSIEDYIRLIERFSFAAILIDQQLGERGVASYTGIQLAVAIREFNPTLPIFILTKYPGDEILEEQGFVLDDVMDKRILHKYARSYIGRLQRSIGRYEEIRSLNSLRLQTLVSQSLSKELTPDEVSELNNLRAGLGLTSLSEQVMLAEQSKINVQIKEDILKALHDLMGDDDI